ncbi:MULTISPECIES: carboxymuconolactone decarboxylase family protein [unclassified Streptomyces]|uniref:carboxymuconolactone decarboxylase family protein n=1 Tax=unclassified Streptomyces TaxID=2593676 RepID=UPI002E75F06D|nr:MULTISPECIES: carboxymuconolactone decarboxylase family protein [unclassified Streptomyces]MEE1760484.1 carboxymuconolactone decarboxylase family protein [Streptomyces sp. SP18BB07]MEE1833180.1 carboxymuconolactone decarboxylase family protein [Streptomyces sp. SP17KL33]
MQARMKNPATVLPEALPAIQGLIKAAHQGGVPQEIMEFTHLRASQINSCSACVHVSLASGRKAGISDERLWGVAAWREAPYYSDAERAALALAEEMTRLGDRSGDAVPDELWDEVADHFDERQIASLVLWIATTNLFNRVNAAIKEPAGTTWG